MEGVNLAGMGRYEEALAIGEAAIATAIALGRPPNATTNYLTLTLREIFSLEEARDRSEAVVDRLGPSDFNMPWMNARADLLGARLILGDLGRVEKDLPNTFEEALALKGWERWLITGRLLAYRAELELEAGRLDDAVTWARRAVESARAVHRRKYETIALTLLGRALTAQGLGDEATAELRSAVEMSDALGSPLLRWQARAGLAASLSRSSSGAGPDPHLQDAASIIREVAASLAPDRAKGYLAAVPVVQVLEAAG
jgi:tetratricopeptide (TPR) repeat protein